MDPEKVCAADVTADCYNSCVHCTYAPPVAACYFSYPSGPPPIVSGGRGIVFDRFLCFFVYLFICLFVCQQDYEKTAGPICMKFSGRCGVTMGRPDYVFGQFRETARCRDAQHGDGVCCAFAPQPVFNASTQWVRSDSEFNVASWRRLRYMSTTC